MHFRSIFLSDIHLGSPDCQAERLIEFLDTNTCNELYLVGDIIDFWSLKKKVCWPDAHTAVMSRLLDLSSRGTKVTYVPGNHDAVVRKVYGSLISGIKVVNELVYQSSKGKRLLVVHGDIFDEIVLTSDWKHRIGADLYDGLMNISRKLNTVRKLLGYTHWSLAAWTKYQFADAVKHIHDYEYAAAREAAKRFHNGIICGHIHHPNIEDIDGMTYLNCGDWVEHATAIVEDEAGEMRLIDWNELRKQEAVVASTIDEPAEERLDRAA